MKTNTHTQMMSNTDPTKNQGWIQVLAKGKQFQPLIRHPFTFVSQKKAWPTYIRMFCFKERTNIILYKKHSDSNKKLSETVIIKMIEFLINIFAMFDVFRLTVGIHMGTNSPTCSLYIQIIKLTYNI
jgi:hypothetical protein